MYCKVLLMHVRPQPHQPTHAQMHCTVPPPLPLHVDKQQEGICVCGLLCDLCVYLYMWMFVLMNTYLELGLSECVAAYVRVPAATHVA